MVVRDDILSETDVMLVVLRLIAGRDFRKLGEHLVHE